MEGTKLEVKVKDISWNTDYLGRLKPLLKLTTDHKIKGSGEVKDFIFDHIAIDNAKTIEDLKLGSGAKVKVLFKEGSLTPDIQEVVNVGNPKYPTHCSSCEGDLVAGDNDIYCHNMWCVAKGRTTILKLIKLATSDQLSFDDYIIVEKWLDKFPVYDGQHPVGDFQTFFTLFGTAGPKDIKPRHDLLIEYFGNVDAVLLRQVENEIEGILNRGLTNIQFWYVSNMPNVERDDQIHKLRNTDPDNLTGGKMEKHLKRLNLSNKAFKTIVLNTTYWRLLKTTIDKFKKIKNS